MPSEAILREESVRRVVVLTWRCLGLACALLLSNFARAQMDYPQLYYTPQEIRAKNLPSLMARSKEPADVLLTSLDTIIHDRSICCEEDSALGDSAEKADPTSLKDISKKLQGRHVLGDGRPIMVTADYWEPGAINSGGLIAALRGNHALLMEWDSHLYVCYGVSYEQDYDPNSGVELDTIQKFLLLDTRYPDSRRHKVFDRATDDWSKVQGMLFIDAKLQ
jgi:hypothetical protein